MSNIAKRIMPQPPTFSIELNADLFATSVMAFFLGDFTGTQVRDFVNGYLVDNQAPELTNDEITDVLNMQLHYASLSNVGKGEYMHRLRAYSNLLQDSTITGFTEAQWDSLMGL